VTLGALDERVVVDYGEPRLMFVTPESLVEAHLSVVVADSSALQPRPPPRGENHGPPLAYGA